LNHLLQWKSQLQDFLSETQSEEEVKLANGAVNILNQVLGFFSDPKNLKLAHWHRLNAGGQNILKPKDCIFGLNENISKTLLKKIIKSKPKSTDCCGQVNACIHKASIKMKTKGSKLSPKLELKIMANAKQYYVNPKNTFQDKNFCATKVLKSSKFLKGFPNNSTESD
jgi:hypothetical protein